MYIHTSRSWKKNRKSLEDDDEGGNLCWSPFSFSPLDLSLLAFSSLAPAGLLAWRLGGLKALWA